MPALTVADLCAALLNFFVCAFLLQHGPCGLAVMYLRTPQEEYVEAAV